MFTRRQIINLLFPLMLEQLLTGLMGIADTMMVTTVGESAISAVALVDSINTLVINLLTALAAGGVIVCAQYLGREDRKRANDAARQVLIVSTVLSLALTVFCLVLRRPLLSLIFGHVEESVMEQALTYFFITALSYPFIGIQQTAAAAFRAGGHSAQPMIVAAVANAINIIGNAVTIYGLDMGVAGAALATTASRVVSGVVLLLMLRRQELPISIRDYRRIRFDRELSGLVLRVGVPTGVENSMFQLGKLVVQSTVSTLGTTAMAAQAMINTLELVQTLPSQAIGTGLLTVAGQCMGAGRVDEARRYTKRFCLYSELTIIGWSAIVMAATPLVTRISKMTEASAQLTIQLVLLCSVAKCVLWVLAFTLPNGMRAAGDVRFATIISTVSMWVFRVGGSFLLCRVFHVGLLGIWLAWFTDWLFRLIVYVWRFRSNTWMGKRVIHD